LFFQSLTFITVVQQITLNIFLSCLFLILLTSITDKQAPAKSCHFLEWCYFIYSNWSTSTQALVSFQKYMPPPLPYFKVNICPFPLLHFASIFFSYLCSFRWPNYIVTLPRYFSFRLPHLNIPTGPPSDELDKNIQRTSLGLLLKFNKNNQRKEHK
jgi:hypothetical protein